MQAREVNTKNPDGLLEKDLEPLIRGLGMSLIELSVFRSKGRNVQVKLVVQKDDLKNGGITGIDDCSKVHRAIMPRLELAFAERDIYLEVSSPGIDRLIKDRDELVHYIGREISCYRRDISDWSRGILLALEADKIILSREGEELALPYEIIAKARLSGLPPPGSGG